MFQEPIIIQRKKAKSNTPAQPDQCRYCREPHRNDTADRTKYQYPIIEAEPPATGKCTKWTVYPDNLCIFCYNKLSYNYSILSPIHKMPTPKVKQPKQSKQPKQADEPTLKGTTNKPLRGILKKQPNGERNTQQPENEYAPENDNRGDELNIRYANEPEPEPEAIQQPPQPYDPKTEAIDDILLQLNNEQTERKMYPIDIPIEIIPDEPEPQQIRPPTPPPRHREKQEKKKANEEKKRATEERLMREYAEQQMEKQRLKQERDDAKAKAKELKRIVAEQEKQARKWEKEQLREEQQRQALLKIAQMQEEAIARAVERATAQQPKQQTQPIPKQQAPPSQSIPPTPKQPKQQAPPSQPAQQAQPKQSTPSQPKQQAQPKQSKQETPPISPTSSYDDSEDSDDGEYIDHKTFKELTAPPDLSPEKMANNKHYNILLNSTTQTSKTTTPQTTAQKSPPTSTDDYFDRLYKKSNIEL